MQFSKIFQVLFGSFIGAALAVWAGNGLLAEEHMSLLYQSMSTANFVILSQGSNFHDVVNTTVLTALTIAAVCLFAEQQSRLWSFRKTVLVSTAVLLLPYLILASLVTRSYQEMFSLLLMGEFMMYCISFAGVMISLVLIGPIRGVSLQPWWWTQHS